MTQSTFPVGGSDFYTTGSNTYNSSIVISPDSDIKIGDRSLRDFVSQVEEHLCILQPAPELEQEWTKLQNLRQQYEACKQDILEKQKIMNILRKA
jgi:hypothetical protein